MPTRLATLVQVLPLLLLILAPATSDAARIQWEFEADGRILGNPTVGETAVYFAGGRVLYALSRDGNELWQRELDGEIAAGVSLHEDVLYVHSSAGVHAVSLRGELLWTYEIEDLGPLVDGRTWGWGNEIRADPWGWYRSAPLVQGDTVFFGNSDGVHALSSQTGAARWQAAVGPVTADPVLFEDTIVAASWNNSIYALDAATGEPRWRFEAQAPASSGVDWVGYLGCNLTPVLHNEKLLVGNRGTYFYSLDARDGNKLWSSKVGASWIGSPALVSGDSVYYGLSDGNAVLGQLVSGGALTLFFKTESAVFARPQAFGEHLVVGTLTGRIFLVDRLSGSGEQVLNLGPDEVDWAGFFDAAIAPSHLSGHEREVWATDRMLTTTNGVLSLTAEEGTAYVGTGTGRLYAVDLAGPP